MEPSSPLTQAALCRTRGHLPMRSNLTPATFQQLSPPPLS